MGGIATSVALELATGAGTAVLFWRAPVTKGQPTTLKHKLAATAFAAIVSYYGPNVLAGAVAIATAAAGFLVAATVTIVLQAAIVAALSIVVARCWSSHGAYHWRMAAVSPLFADSRDEDVVTVRMFGVVDLAVAHAIAALQGMRGSPAQCRRLVKTCRS